MSAKRPIQEPVSNGASFKLSFLRHGKHVAVVHLPEDYHAPIGRIIAHWGQFEDLFNACLESLLDGEAADVGKRRPTEGLEFRRRRALFKVLCSEWLATWQPEVAAEAIKLCDTAGDLKWKRDMIAHGKYAFTIPARSSDAVNCRALNKRTGGEFPFDQHILDKLYHDLAHLTAEMVFCFSRAAKIEVPFPILPDTQLLQAARRTNRLSDTNQDTHPPPPQS